MQMKILDAFKEEKLRIKHNLLEKKNDLAIIIEKKIQINNALKVLFEI